MGLGEEGHLLRLAKQFLGYTLGDVWKMRATWKMCATATVLTRRRGLYRELLYGLLRGIFGIETYMGSLFVVGQSHSPKDM